tara:strand:- start:167 stop:394 length:228 start_codon:yes stop_codon:yes gene_type:complete
MNKYKNKDGIELNFGGMSKAGRKGSGGELVQEVVGEAVKILSTYDRNSKISMNMAIGLCREFLKENFDLGEQNGK